MKDGKPERRFAYAKQPVNRRTALARELSAPTVSPAALDRARKLQARNRLGPPLAEAVAQPRHPLKSPRLPGVSIAMLVGATALIPLAVLSTSWPLRLALGAGALVLLAAAGWSGRRALRAVRADRDRAVEGAAPMVDPELLRALDHVMETVSAEVPEQVFPQLLALKTTLLNVLRLLPSTGSGAFAMDDKLYVVECVRRYLPDTIEAYLRVPSPKRDVAIDQGRSATAVFSDQLSLIQQELERREHKGVIAAGDKLMQQQRFLEAKARER